MLGVDFPPRCLNTSDNGEKRVSAGRPLRWLIKKSQARHSVKKIMHMKLIKVRLDNIHRQEIT